MTVTTVGFTALMAVFVELGLALAVTIYRIIDQYRED